jgi:uncharacterized membrane protein YhaH (DUF805 family)
MLDVRPLVKDFWFWRLLVLAIICGVGIFELQGLKCPDISAMMVNHKFAHPFLTLTVALIDVKALPSAVSNVVQLRDRKSPHLWSFFQMSIVMSENHS